MGTIPGDLGRGLAVTATALVALALKGGNRTILRQRGEIVEAFA